MKIEEFKYTKKTGETSNRKIMVLTNNKDYIDAIDFDKVDEKERKIIIEAQKEYEEKLAPYMKKSFRRFSKSGMSDIKELNEES